MIKQNDILLILFLSVFSKILYILGNKKDETITMFLNAKILSRLNVILLEIYSDENIADAENTHILLEKIFDILIKVSEVNKINNNNKYLLILIY
jgi:hypothetical protein